MSTWVTQRRLDKRARLAAIASGARRLEGVSQEALHELESALFGYLLVPGDEGYAAATRQENPLFERHPFAVVYCEHRMDVAVCIKWCRRHRRSATFRSGGHSTAGYSVLDGTLTVDVSQLDHVHVDPDAMLASCEPGVNFGKLNTVLDHYRLHVPGGGCETVCVAGYMQGGGYGFTSRPFGMNCDNVERIRFYDRDGHLRTASAGENPELFWAFRGGTGGTFGAVVEITYRLRLLGAVWGFGLKWDLDKAPAALDLMQRRYMRGGPAALGYMTFIIGTEGAPALYMRGMCVEGEAVGRKLLAPLIETAEQPILSRTARYAELNTWLLEDLAPKDLGAINEVKVSNYIDRPLDLAGWQRVVEIYRQEPGYKAAAANTLTLEPYGGAIEEGGPGLDIDNAFIHRQVDTDFVVDSFYGSADEKRAAEAWLARYSQFLRGPGGVSNRRVYQNYPEPGLGDWDEAYFGAARGRLHRIKAAVDPSDAAYPQGFFHFPQSVRP